MSERKEAVTAFAEQGLWSVGEAVKERLPPGLSIAFVSGMTGGAIRAAGVPPTFSELQALLIPGMAALGLHAELLPFPEEDAVLLRQFQERLRRGIPIPIFAFAGLSESRMATENTDDTDSGPSSPYPTPASLIPLEASPSTPPTLSVSSVSSGPSVIQTETKQGATRAGEREVLSVKSVSSSPSVIQTEASGQGLVVRLVAGGSYVSWQEVEGAEKQTSIEGLRAAFSHLMSIRRENRKGSRRAAIQAALLRWLAFAEAFPGRLPVGNSTEAAAFLREVAGRKRDPVAIRLRRAATGFAEARSSGDVYDALHRLREAVLLDLRLPSIAQEALLSEATEPLSDIARRELIYLARAGTRDIKVLAARRLQSERHHADAHSTLEQLAYDPDPWVRTSVSA